MIKIILLVVFVAVVAALFFGGPSSTTQEYHPTVSAPGTPAPAPTPVGAPAAPLSPNTSMLDAQLAAAARATNVELKILDRTLTEIRLQVTWMGDVASLGGDFVDELIKKGLIRDFTDLGKRPWVDQDMRTHYTWELKLKIK